MLGICITIYQAKEKNIHITEQISLTNRPSILLYFFAAAQNTLCQVG